MFGRFHIFTVVVLLCGFVFAASPLVKDTVFVAFDTETTGLSAKTERVVEIGAVKFCGDGTVLAATNWLVNPQCEIPWQATQVHGISNDMVAEAPLFAEVWPEFETFCDGAILLAHNAPFDIRFVSAELERAKIDPPALKVGDTLPLFRKWFPHALSHSLEPLSVYLGVHGDTYHRAEADALVMIDIIKLWIKKHPEMTLRRFESDAKGFERLDGNVRSRR